MSTQMGSLFAIAPLPWPFAAPPTQKGIQKPKEAKPPRVISNHCIDRKRHQDKSAALHARSRKRRMQDNQPAVGKQHTAKYLGRMRQIVLLCALPTSTSTRKGANIKWPNTKSSSNCEVASQHLLESTDAESNFSLTTMTQSTTNTTYQQAAST